MPSCRYPQSGDIARLRPMLTSAMGQIDWSSDHNTRYRRPEGFTRFTGLAGGRRKRNGRSVANTSKSVPRNKILRGNAAPAIKHG